MAKQLTSDNIFREGDGLINVYFMKVDASGHSSVIRENPHDKSDILFDLIEDTIYDLVKSKRKLYSCLYADFWGWQGDGGLCVFYDPRESVANAAALDSAIHLIDRTLPSLREDLDKLQVKGSLDLRVALHKGAFRYKARHGSLHSRELNFVAHLESVTPRNSVTISSAVFQASPPQIKSKFQKLDFPFEDETVHCYSQTDLSNLAFQWIGRVPISGSVPVNMFTQRPTQFDKAMMIRHATEEVVVLGTALRTCSGYLTTKEKPGLYRQAVLTLLDSGVNYTSLLLNPDTETARIYQSTRHEDIVAKINESLRRLRSFAAEVQGKPGRFSVYAYESLPRVACIGVDRERPGLLLVSPYIPTSQDFPIDRADTLHYVLTYNQDAGLYAQINGWVTYCRTDRRTIQLI
jgi:hypothetical protein